MRNATTRDRGRAARPHLTEIVARRIPRTSPTAPYSDGELVGSTEGVFLTKVIANSYGRTI